MTRPGDPLVLVINLDRSRDRLGAIADELAAAGLAWERIPGVEPNAAQHPAERHGLITRGEVGCWLGHNAAYRRLLDSGASAALVLEDDATLEPGHDWPALLQGLVRGMAASAVQVLQVGWIRPRPARGLGAARRALLARGRAWLHDRTGLVGSERFPADPSARSFRLIRDDFRGGAHAYLVTLTAAAALVDTNVPVTLPADLYLRALGRLRRRGAFSIGRLDRCLSYQRSQVIGEMAIDSDIAAAS